ncbi:tRNA1(Val) (adenine(37)-N6)-methyltransferase [Nitrincola alkalilacustris]|uniref:tRNA1(Val) (adenine(37)-N6)-methyltransferase n=1 Tax=Nitrincola alkalilacustris TaxID=1571224 RepID=UPI00124DF2EE|nr:methyltransferase [Nitrincola alkalilacustris]
MTRRVRNTFFQCREFRIEQDRCAMKVTTDACLLGAWVAVEQAKQILDIGTGSGLLALFAAQRSQARVDGVEIEPEAARQAAENFAASPWSDRLRVIQADIRDHAELHVEGYDLILCNPPFFSDSTHNPCQKLATARHNSALPLTDLLHAAHRLLQPDGSAWFLLPVAEAMQMADAATAYALYPAHRLWVRNSPSDQPHRQLLQLTKTEQPASESSFTLYDPHPFHTPEAAKLFAPYYINIR